MKLKSNKIQCLTCLQVLESKHSHDFVGCQCFESGDGTQGCAVDGGLFYQRVIGEPGSYKDLSEWEEGDAVP